MLVIGVEEVPARVNNAKRVACLASTVPRVEILFITTFPYKPTLHNNILIGSVVQIKVFEPMRIGGYLDRPEEARLSPIACFHAATPCANAPQPHSRSQSYVNTSTIKGQL